MGFNANYNVGGLIDEVKKIDLLDNINTVQSIGELATVDTVTTVGEVKKINLPPVIFPDPDMMYTYVKGLQMKIPAINNVYFRQFQVPWDCELVSVSVVCSGYDDDDYWELLLFEASVSTSPTATTASLSSTSMRAMDTSLGTAPNPLWPSNIGETDARPGYNGIRIMSATPIYPAATPSTGSSGGDSVDPNKPSVDNLSLPGWSEKKLVETCYTKELPETITLHNTYPKIPKDSIVEVDFYNLSATSKTVWINLKFLHG